MGSVEVNAVYFVESKAPHEPLAIRPKIDFTSVEWEDTARGRHLDCHKIIEDGFYVNPQQEIPRRIPKKIEIVDHAGNTFVLKKLTLELYNKHVRDRVAGKPEFKTEEELVNYYLETDFHPYG